MKLSIKMIIFCLLIGILPLAGMVGYSIETASGSLKSEAFDKLASITQAKKHNLEDIIESWQKDVAVYAGARGVYSALVRLRDIAYYNSEPGKPMDVTNEEFVHGLKRVERDFNPFVETMGYQDALLMDDTGRIIFTARRGKELGRDLSKGSMAGSQLARAWKQALSGKFVFVDFHPYGPLDGAPNAFVVAPVKRVTGEIEGAAALRIPLKGINRLMKSRAGMGKTGETFLVGSDNLMRSDMHSDMAHHSVVASFRDAKAGKLDVEAVRLALAGKSGTLIYTDVSGKDLLAAYAPVKIGSTRWALVSQVAEKEAFAGVSKLEQAALVLSSGSCVAIIFITLLFLRIVLFKPLHSLRVFAGAVSDGDLKASARGSFKAELAEVRDSIVIMVENLRTMMDEAQEASEEAGKRADEAEAALEDARTARRALMDADEAQRRGMLQASQMLENIVTHMNEASGLVNNESENIRENALSQQMRVEQTVDAIEAMSENITAVAQSASQASEAARVASDRATSGSAVVHKAVEAIGEVNSITEQLKGEAGELGDRADGIGKVMNVISDIADQTNLLALNAAIEAARAGEAGRGFAVVADEVRKLAEKTMDATREVGGSITSIQSGVRNNLEGMDRAAKAVDKANGYAGESGLVLDEILKHFQQASEQVEGIARASEQQSVAGHQISEAVSEVDKVTLGTANAVNETSKAINGLTGQIAALTKLCGLFRLLGEGVVQGEVESLSSLPDIQSMKPSQVRTALESAVHSKDFLELAWVTDRDGNMVSDVVQSPDAVCTLGSELCGKNWADKEWFTEPMRTGEIFVSSIYYSDIVNDYCLTISTPVFNGDGAPKGVLAVDIRPSGSMVAA